MPPSPLSAPLAIAVRLAEVAPPGQLYEWLRDAAGDPPAPALSRSTRFHDRMPPKALLEALVARGEPLLDIAVATYGTDHDVLIALWGRGDPAIRMAIADNRFREGLLGLSLIDVLSSGDQALVNAALANPSMTPPALARVLERKEPLDQLTDAQWRVGVRAVARCPVLRLEENWLEDGRFETDGWGSIQRSSAKAAAWKLARELEPTVDNASVLSVLLDGLRLDAPVHEYDYDASSRTGMQDAIGRFVQAMLVKWQRPADAPPLDDLAWDSFGVVRTCIAAAAARQHMLVEFLRTSDDKATRLGFYQTAMAWTPDTIREAAQRDGTDFLHIAVSNPRMHERTYPEWGAAVEDAIDAFDQTNTRSQDTFANPLSLRSAWHAMGLKLWRQSSLMYLHPDKDQQTDNRTQIESLSLFNALALVERRALATSRWQIAALNDAVQKRPPAEARAATMAVEATWSALLSTIEAVRCIAREMDAAKARETDGSAMTAAVVRGTWQVIGSIVVIGGLLIAAGRLL